ncbi:MAG: LamG domain-containing protein [Limisphaerales bacterium]
MKTKESLCFGCMIVVAHAAGALADDAPGQERQAQSGIVQGEVLAAGLRNAATPLHHYSFENSAVTDSVGSANGTLLNGAVVQHGALNLDGISAYVEFSEPLIPVSDDFSVAFFARELSPTSDRAEVISQGRWFGPGFYMGYYPPSRSVRLGDEWQETGVRFPGDGQWHHYALTVDGNGSRFYVDGLLVTNSQTIHIAAGGNNTRLGRQYEPWPEYFHGAVAELWIYQGRLTAEEVAKLAAARPNALSESLNVSLNFSRILAAGGKTGITIILGLLLLLFVGVLMLLLLVLALFKAFAARRAVAEGVKEAQTDRKQ